MRLAEIDLDEYYTFDQQDIEKIYQEQKTLEDILVKKDIDPQSILDKNNKKYQEKVKGKTLLFDNLPKFNNLDLNTPEFIENLSVYYLAKVLQKTIEFLESTETFKNPEYSANIGVPVQYCDSLCLLRFNKVLRLAWLLKDDPNLETLKIGDLSDQINQLKPKLNKNILCFAVPEVAAGAYFYAISPKNTTGYVLYIDIGSGTTEFCYFHFSKDNQEKAKLDAIQAYSPTLGIDTIVANIAKESGKNETEVKNLLIDKKSSLVNNIDELIVNYVNKNGGNVNKGEFIATVAKRQHEAVKKNAQENYNPYYYITQEAIERELKVKPSKEENMFYQFMLFQRAIHLHVAELSQDRILMGGGGKDSSFFRYSIESTYSAFRQFKDSSRYKLQDYEMKNFKTEDHKKFQMNDVDDQYAHRFSIAFGLSIPNNDMPEFRLPSQSNVPPKPPEIENKRLVSTKIIYDAVKRMTAI